MELFVIFFFALACEPEPADTDKVVEDTGDTAAEVTDDRDGDGVPDDADCDPDNANVYPGHGEIPYNGRDDDCDGFDITDVDGDGYDGDSMEGGTDCDDNSATVNPAAPEICYNDIDDNCDGWEGGLDCDGDGYPLGSDCDDESASSYPGAADAWYDGIDSNCLGDDDYDQDVDGEESIEYGGTDCEDTNAEIFSDQDESWNGVDDDCEGTVDVMTENAYFGRVSGDSAISESSFASAFALVPDLDGDGRKDFWIGAWESSDDILEYSGHAWAIGSGEGITTSASEGLGLATGGYAYSQLGYSVAAVSAGGHDQLAATAPYYGVDGVTYFYDPTDMPLAGGTIDAGKVEGTIAYTGSGGLVDEEDGRVIIGSYPGVLHPILTAWPEIPAGDSTDADAFFLVQADAAVSEQTAFLGDLDGDGESDVGVITTTLAPATTLSLAWSNILDIGGNYALEDFDQMAAFELPSAISAVGDLDGDGLDDAAITYSSASGAATGDGRIYLVGGASFVSGSDLLASAISTLSGGVDSASLRPGNVADLDNDGSPELLFGMPGIGVVGSISLSELAISGDHVPSTRAPWFTSGSADQFGAVVFGDDIDGDGDDDLMASRAIAPGALYWFFQE